MKRIKINKFSDEIVEVLCNRCKIETNHKIIVSVDTSGEDDIGYNETISWRDDYQIVQCLGCEGISFININSNSEDRDEDGYINNISIFPDRCVEKINSKEFSHLPYNLERLYDETTSCYNNKNNTLCAAGLRSMVEALCVENES